VPLFWIVDRADAAWIPVDPLVKGAGIPDCQRKWRYNAAKGTTVNGNLQTVRAAGVLSRPSILNSFAEDPSPIRLVAADWNVEDRHPNAAVVI